MTKNKAKKWAENIKACYQESTEKDKADGTKWYDNVRARCEKWAVEFGRSVETVAGVYAVLSPGTTWALNERDAYNVLKYGAEWRTATYKSNHLKALRIMKGGNLESTTTKEAKKVRAFYASILGDVGAVCIDRHAGAIAEGRELSDAEKKTLRRKKYDDVAGAYRKVAAEVGINPRDLQAITWTHYRRNLDKKLSEVTPF